MRRYQTLIHICVFIIIVVIAFNDEYNPFVLNDAKTVSKSINDAVKTEDPLYKKILEEKSNYTEPPQDAKIDRVWKKTPGRNGIKVNVEKSYQQMKKEGLFDKTLLVYEQVPPKVTLKDLPASPIYRGHPKKQMVSFLINVSWGTEHIPSILKILKKHNVKATFFIEGKWAKSNAEFVEMIDEEDHVIGNHAYNHPEMTRLNKQEIAKQINQTNEIIKAITGDTPEWFAPPSGSFNNQVVKVADDLNMETILWTVDTIDWKNPSVSVMMNRVINNIHPGATILMHPTSSMVQGLDSLINNLKEKGYNFGSIDKLLSEER